MRLNFSVLFFTARDSNEFVRKVLCFFNTIKTDSSERGTVSTDSASHTFWKIIITIWTKEYNFNSSLEDTLKTHFCIFCSNAIKSKQNQNWYKYEMCVRFMWLKQINYVKNSCGFFLIITMLWEDICTTRYNLDLVLILSFI